MDTAALLLVLAIAGVNFGWQPADNDRAGYEYIVQVEPELLDARQRGEAVPIESNIPPEVTPIRKVRIVVGRGEVPRSTVRHTANFAEPTGWNSGQYPAPSTTGSGRYAAPAGSNAAGVGPPLTLLDRAGTAASETARALGEGIQAGTESAGNQLSRAGSELVNDAANATQDMGEQFQQWSGEATRQAQAAGNNLRTATAQTFEAANNQLRQTANPFAATGNGASTTGSAGVSAPPWPSAASTASAPEWATDAAAQQTLPIDYAQGTSITRTATGWTSIGTNVAAPPLLNPPLSTTPTTGVRVAATTPSGPAFPTGTTAGRQPIHSQLIDPAAQAGPAGPAARDWASDWASNSTAPTISRETGISITGNSPGGLGVSSERPPAQPTAQDTQRAANRWDDPWPTQPAGTLPPNPPQSSGQFANNGQPAASLPAPPTIGVAAIDANARSQELGNNLATQVSPPEQPPWLPLLLVSLSLVGSLSANLFLGWSYMDARQKYRALVRKTADTFRRVAGAAAA